MSAAIDRNVRKSVIAVTCTVTAWCPRRSRIGSAQRAVVEAHNDGPTKWSRFSNLWVRRVYLRRTGSSGCHHLAPLLL